MLPHGVRLLRPDDRKVVDFRQSERRRAPAQVPAVTELPSTDEDSDGEGAQLERCLSPLLQLADADSERSASPLLQLASAAGEHAATRSDEEGTADSHGEKPGMEAADAAKIWSQLARAGVKIRERPLKRRRCDPKRRFHSGFASALSLVQEASGGSQQPGAPQAQPQGALAHDADWADDNWLLESLPEDLSQCFRPPQVSSPATGCSSGTSSGPSVANQSKPSTAYNQRTSKRAVCSLFDPEDDLQGLLQSLAS